MPLTQADLASIRAQVPARPQTTIPMPYEDLLRKILMTYDADNDSYINFNEQVVIDASDANLTDDEVEKLKKRTKAHIEKGCTVMHTYAQETPVRMDIEVRR